MALDEMRLIKTVSVTVITFLIAKLLGRMFRRSSQGLNSKPQRTIKRFDTEKMDVSNADFIEINSRRKRGNAQ